MCVMPMDMPAPAPPENQGAQRPKEGGEPGESTSQPDYGAAVDAFNDMDSARPDGGGNSSFDNFINDLSNGFENGPPSTNDMGGGAQGDNRPPGGSENPGSNWNPGGDRGLPGGFNGPPGGLGNFQPGHEGGGGLGSQDARDRPPSMDSSSPGGHGSIRDGSPESGSNHPSQDDGQADIKNPDMNLDEGDQGTGKSSDKEDGSKPEDVPKDIPKENPRDQNTEKPPIPGDNMLSRLARGEPTEKDLEKLEKERVKQMYSGSAVPAFSGKGSQTGKGGSSHAEPQQTGPSRLTQYQAEIKAREAKWDAIQSWNHQAIKRAEAQDEQMRANLRKVSKG